MEFCAKCGETLEEGANFCGGCGNVVTPSGQSAGSGQVVAMSAAANSGMTANLAAALSYILGFITGIIFLVIEPYKHDRFVRFHAMQSILFSVVGVIYRVAWSILVHVTISISHWLALLLVPVGLLLSIGFFVLWLFVMYQAYQGREFRIPVIGDIAAKQVANFQTQRS